MEKYLALKASAGSGKTFALSVRYISLLLLDVNPSTILTLTFTNKAALEMSERIFKTLVNLGNDQAIIDAIEQQTKLSKDEIISKKDLIVKTFLQSELSILTLDKFMNKVLREFSGYLGLGEDFAILNNDHDFLLYKFLLSLDEEHFDALIHFSHHFDTKLLSIVKLFDLLDEKNEEYQYYEFENNILEGFKENALSYGFEIKKAVESLGLSASALKAVDFTSLDELMVKTWLEKDSLQEYHYFKKAKEKIVVFDEQFAALKEQLTYYINYKEQGDLNTLFKIYNYYREFRLKFKKNKNQLKFSDVTNLVYELLNRYIDKDFLYFRLDSRYEHIMIDEFQDTSVLQFKILKPLIDEILSGNDTRFKTFFYVGDTKQSIYRFRGGKKELFDYVLNNYGDDLKLGYLNTNYRSAKNVVGVTNDIFLAQHAYPYQAQEVNSTIDGYVEVCHFKDEQNPYDDVKTQVQNLLSMGVNPNKIAVLTYTNEDVLGVYKYLKEHFSELKISTDMTSKLIEQNNVKALINAIKYFYFNEEIYLANFNTLVGNELKKSINCLVNIKTEELKSIIYKIAYEYGILDDNVIKFIEKTESYKDIVEFVYEIDSEESTMISESNSGLKILTIFKSKGLEFDTVILLDRIKNKNADKSKLLFSYDDIELNRIFFKKKERLSFDTFYKNAIEQELELTKDDELNILYVAITRAKYNLIIVKKEKNSVFDTLNFEIVDLKRGVIYISQDIQASSNKPSEVEYNPIHLGIQNIDAKSSLLDDSENLKARYFGLATHYCLEIMDSLTMSSLDTAFWQMQSKYHQYLSKNDLDEVKQRISLLLENHQFQSFLENNDYEKEQELIFDGELKIIDLLIECDEKYIVIDYKTTSGVSDSHFEQVKLYKDAVKDITKKEVDGYLVYLKNDEVVFHEVK